MKTIAEKKLILKVLVGSRAHGLASEDSDYDYRGVYAVPTRDLLSLGYTYKSSNWVEGKVDDTSYELGHFLHLATKCNPSILEVFRAPIVEATEEGKALQELFKYVWNPQDSFNAFVGYGLNQRKKMLENKDDRPAKYAVAYIRTLHNLTQLLSFGKFDMEVTCQSMRLDLLRYKSGTFSNGEIVDKATDLTDIARGMKDLCKQQSDVEKVNDFLLKVRKENW